MGAIVFIEGDGTKLGYLLPAPQALDHLAQQSWVDLVQRCNTEHQRGNRNYAVQFISSIAAAYEIQSWKLHHRASELSKVVFFRKLALALARKVKPDAMAELQTKYAFSLLVKATFDNTKNVADDALQQARLVIALKPNTPRTMMLLARMLLWAVCDSDASGDAVHDMSMAIHYIEESIAQLPNQYNRTYGAPQDLQRAYQARYILQGDESDLQKASSLLSDEEGEGPEAEADFFSQRLIIARQEFEADNPPLNLMYYLVRGVSDVSAEEDTGSASGLSNISLEEDVDSASDSVSDDSDILAQQEDALARDISDVSAHEDVDLTTDDSDISVQEDDTLASDVSDVSAEEDVDLTSDDSDISAQEDVALTSEVTDVSAEEGIDLVSDLSNLSAQEDAESQGLRKIYHTMSPGLAREAMEAALLACQCPVEVEEGQKQPASNFIIGINYLMRSRTGKDARFDLEKAISYLEAAQNEASIDSKEHLQSSVSLAEAHWRLGHEVRDIAQLHAGMESMVLLLDRLTPEVHTPDAELIEMMEKSYHFWTISNHVLLLTNAAKFLSYLLRDNKKRDLPPDAVCAVLCEGGEIAADMYMEQPDQSLVQDPLVYWTRCWQDKRARLNIRLHAMHLAAQHLFRRGCYEDAYQHARTAVELIRFACPAHLDTSERKDLIPLLNGISVDACALAIKLGRIEEAMELLEQGRGILNFLPDAFADSLDDLRREHPGLYSRFDECRQGIIASISSQDPSIDARIDLEKPIEVQGDDDVTEMCNILAEIRQQPNFKDFYRPITAGEMQSLATTGPVVVLVGSSLHLYAVVVRQDGMQAVDLSPEAVEESPFWKANFLTTCSEKLNHILGRELVRLDFSSGAQVQTQFKRLNHAERARSLTGLLSLLWIAVVEPINRVLKYQRPKLEGEHRQGVTLMEAVLNSVMNHVTWIRTGTFTRMPVHVATDNGGIPFITYAISSYVASFQSLSASHSRHRVATRGMEDGLFVTMPSKVSRIPKDSPFLNGESVKTEVSVVTKAAKSINWSTLERPSAQQVKERFSDARFIHFICHGVENRKEPRKSHLKLWQETGPGRGRVDPLYISEISTWLTRKTSLVFLSACSVADAEDPSFSDENLDIANSFAVAGVPDIVGSMWEVESSVAIAVARWFWHFLSSFFPKGGQVFSGDLVARALQVAIIITSGDWHGDPLTWAGFIHIGGMSSNSLADVRDGEDDEEVSTTADSESGKSGDEASEDKDRMFDPAEAKS
ncbi:MAG: hypothetical protein Q9212_004201 [Teloschistes hypoglaucus]